MADRQITTCECEGCERPGEEAHHVFYGGKKRGKHKMPELDMDMNLQVVCKICHGITGKAKSFENKEYFWGIQCERYGHQPMIEWHDNLRLKVKERIYR